MQQRELQYHYTLRLIRFVRSTRKVKVSLTTDSNRNKRLVFFYADVLHDSNVYIHLFKLT